MTLAQGLQGKWIAIESLFYITVYQEMLRLAISYWIQLLLSMMDILLR